MDFDYYFKKYDEEYGFNDSELCGFEIGFEAGQQSKQEEVNKLQEEIYRLQKRINESVELLEYNEYIDSHLQVLDVLKGE